MFPPTCPVPEISAIRTTSPRFAIAPEVQAIKFWNFHRTYCSSSSHDLRQQHDIARARRHDHLVHRIPTVQHVSLATVFWTAMYKAQYSNCASLICMVHILHGHS